MNLSCNKLDEPQAPLKGPTEIGVVSKSNLAFATDDLMGCIAGMGWGAIAGPFGAFCGGASLGVYMSVRDLSVIPIDSPVNPTEDIGPVMYVIADDNPYELIGNIHNKAMQHIFENSASFYLNDETFDIDAYKAWAPTFYSSFPELSGYNLNAVDFQSYVDELDTLYIGDLSFTLNRLDSNGVISSEVKVSLNDYWVGISALLSNDDRKTFYRNYVDEINNSTVFTPEEKIILLGSSGLGIFSLLYHSAN